MWEAPVSERKSGAAEAVKAESVGGEESRAREVGEMSRAVGVWSGAAGLAVEVVVGEGR